LKNGGANTIITLWPGEFAERKVTSHSHRCLLLYARVYRLRIQTSRLD
jgi:hypothetical protein